MTGLSTNELNVPNELSAIYEDLAHGKYGLTLVTQYAHAVQAGALARQQGLPAKQVVAALLHDLGHMVHDLGELPAAQGIDDQHERIGADWLARFFSPATVEPIRLHVEAKRYLCAVDADYLGQLSDDSMESLMLQGGVMTAEEVTAFESQDYWREAVTLRRIDEAAKDPNGPQPPYSSFREDIVEALRNGR